MGYPEGQSTPHGARRTTLANAPIRRDTPSQRAMPATLLDPNNDFVFKRLFAHRPELLADT